MPGFYETLGSAPETARLEKKAQGFYETLAKPAKEAKKVAKAGLKFAGDVIGPPARFLGSALEFPVAAAAKYGLGTDVPLEFSPEAGMKQFESPQGQGFLRTIAGPLPPFTPAGADIAANLAMAGPMNALGRGALMPLARAGLEPLRGLPGIKSALEFTKTGASLPAEYRGFVQDLLRSAEGQADLAGYLREKLVLPVTKMPLEQQARLRTAIEVGDLASLPADQQTLAHRLIADWQGQVKERVAAGLKPFERRPGVEYAGGRVGTTQARQEMLKGQPHLAFTNRPGRLYTGKMGQIAEENLPLTTEAVAAKVSEAAPNIKPENVFEPLGRASAMSGEKHDIRLMNARIVGGLVDKYGKPGAQPYESVARHFGVKTGFSPGMQARLETTKLPPQIDELVANLNKRSSPEEFGRIQRASKWINQGFKKWALFSPGYTSRNLQNNIFQILVNEGFSPRDAANMPKIMAILAKPDEAKVHEWIKMGVSGRGQTAREIGKGGGVTGLARSVNTQVEDKSRQLLYELQIAKGKSPTEAARRVDDLLFNYSQRFANPARRKIGQQFVPFVNWQAFIPGLAARTMIERPGSVGFLSNLRDRQNRSLGYSDERLAKEFGPWNLPQGVVATGQGAGFIPQFAGQYSVNDIVPTGLTSALDKLLTKIYPTISTPAQLGTGREAFTSRPFQYETKQGMKDRFATSPSSMRLIFSIPGGKEFAAKHGITLDKETGKVIAPSRLVLVLKSFPQSRIYDLIADYAAGVKGKEAQALSFGAGIRPVTKYEPKKR